MWDIWYRAVFNPGWKGPIKERDYHSSRSIHDANEVNPNGSVAVDTTPSEKSYFCYSKIFKLGTQNINGLNIGKLNIVKNEMNSSTLIN